eukprot:CAMPEP_0197704242 /NCGR_PEP_ID=MMETSP1338-20131121/125837_1 /TAXON_ID=43686 ORGANISM="Pelagodinium beii, Strain RCC1491" /NCGR_SAMPLE_ID=MMETSP1338 /ASSEMBLY_ACC=CAM_ASM_000754 /LENGTH=249 /DNA_ID=CAMNT_0043288141 /DNA_START=686 /DNA_END=1435 /DNA_ORIENTATION=-
MESFVNALLEMSFLGGVALSALVWTAVLLSFWANPWCSVEIKRQNADRFLGTIHAIVTGVLGVSVEALTVPQCVTKWSWTKLPVLVLLGFLVVDMASMLICDVWQRWRPIDKVMIFHHVVLLGLFATAYTCDVGLWFGSAMGINELSTPCVNIFWYLRDTGQKDSKAFMINGILLLALFFLCRVVYIPYNYYHFWALDSCKTSSNEEYHRLAWVINFAYVAMYSLNLMWFAKLVTGAVKTLRKEKGPDE